MYELIKEFLCTLSEYPKFHTTRKVDVLSEDLKCIQASSPETTTC